MVKLGWCGQHGIKIIEPNENLSREYLTNAEETLRVLIQIENSPMWSATMKYYLEDFATYSFFMRLGVKSEVHECTIELCRFFESEGALFSGVADRLERDKQLRIDNQYYLKNKEVIIDEADLHEFIIQMRETILRMTDGRIRALRSRLGQRLAENKTLRSRMRGIDKAITSEEMTRRVRKNTGFRGEGRRR